MTDKQLVIDTVTRLPDGATLDEITEEVALLAALRRSEQQANEGRVTPHDEVKRMMRSWTSTSK
jgi:predicted transcriptional regulator